MTTYYITKPNLLDLIESFGRDMKSLTYPSAHPYDDAKRAKSYEPKYQAARQAWKCIRGDIDPLKVVKSLINTTCGIEANQSRLLESALLGDFEWSEEKFKNPPKGFHWVTYQGDFYGVSSGDHLNLPHVQRLANEYLPEEKRVLGGAQAIANMMPNPCTRITRPIQVS